MAAKQTPVRSIHERGNGVRALADLEASGLADLELQNWLLAFVIVVVLADAVVLGLAASSVTLHARQLLLFAGLLVCSAATVELTRRVGENTGMVKDVYATWELPAALLAAAGLRAAAAHRPHGLTQWRIKRAPTYRRVFSAAVVGLSYVAAALTFHGLIRLAPGAAAHPASHALAWMLVAAACAAVQWTINQVLIWTAIKGSESGRAAPRRAVDPRAHVQRRGRAVRGGDRHVLRGEQHASPCSSRSPSSPCCSGPCATPGWSRTRGSTPRPAC